MTQPGEPRVLFIGGLGRSGSTILDLMLGQLPGFVAVGELSYLWARSDRDLCGCGRAFAECPFWTEVGDAAFGGWSRVDRERLAGIRQRIDRVRGIPRLVARDPSTAGLHELSDASRRLYRGIMDVSGAGVVVDSTKHPSTAFLLRAIGGLDLRVVHLIRDSRGVAYSWTKEMERPGIAGGAMMDRYPPPRMAVRWLGYNALFHALPAFGVSVMRLRYEDLVRRPAYSLRRISAFVGSSSNGFPFLRGRSLSLGEAHTIGGNPIRFDRGPMDLIVDEAWRSALPTGQRRLVTVVTAPMLAGYGYLRASGVEEPLERRRPSHVAAPR